MATFAAMTRRLLPTYWHKNGPWIRWLFPAMRWHVPTRARQIYLTFDDGPVEGVTDFVLAQLARHQARATFFCVGDNLRKQPALHRQLRAQGHRLGNHTYHHLNGWRTPTATYLDDVEQCAHLLTPTPNEGRPLFRPPYGRCTARQRRSLSGRYQVVMWSVLTGDFDPDLPPEVCLRRALRHTGPGSIVVFHDSRKAERTLRYVLPRFLDHFAAAGYRFCALPD